MIPVGEKYDTDIPNPYICILLVILLFMITGICFLYFGKKQIQNAIKNKICNNVIKYEDELQEVVKKCPLEEALYYYKNDADDELPLFYGMIICMVSTIL